MHINYKEKWKLQMKTKKQPKNITKDPMILLWLYFPNWQGHQPTLVVGAKCFRSQVQMATQVFWVSLWFPQCSFTVSDLDVHFCSLHQFCTCGSSHDLRPSWSALPTPMAAAPHASCFHIAPSFNFCGNLSPRIWMLCNFHFKVFI